MEPSPREIVRRGLFEVKTFVAQRPSLALPIARRRHGIVFGPDTQLVIEGFPRTGTSFAVAAFDQAQPSKVQVACHVHAPAQVIAAVRRGIPAMVVIREPEDTALSFVIRHHHVSMAQAIRGYVRFYEPLLRWRDGFVVARFRDVTSDFGACTRSLNERFGASFAPFEHTEENVARVFAAIEADYTRRVSGEALERSVARPSEFRARLKAELKDAYAAETLTALRRRAERVHAALSE